jgi:hypothetical protein
MQTIDVVKYVKNLQIENPVATFPFSKNVAPIAEGEEQTFLNAKSLVSFVSEVSGQQREDVLNSVLLAQLAANKQFPEDTQLIDWYKSFSKALNNLGWTLEGKEFSTFKSATDIFEVENAIVDILTTAFGGTFKTIITKTLASIKGLSDNNGKITAFEKNTHSLSKGAFQLGLVQVENGTVSLQLGMFVLTSSNEIKKILFFKSSKDKTRLDYCSQKGTLNEDVYSTVREPIVTKLGKKVTDFISEVEI